MGALTGIRVIDLTNALAGASATKLLTDLGADVIKIEDRVQGDFTRSLMPSIFHSHNRNKRSLSVDLHTAEGVALVRRLVQNADIFVQSLRPGAAAGLGLDREILTAINPRLIYASFSAFSQRGPSAARRGVDAVAQAESGMVQIQEGLLGNISYVDTVAGLALSHAIMSALLNRQRTGRVDSVEANLLDAALYMQSAPLAEFSVSGQVPDQRNYPTKYPVVGLYPAQDGDIQVAAYYERDWVALCGILERPDLLTDDRFSDQEQRRRHIPELREILEREFRRQPRHHWVEQLSRHRILGGIVRDYGEVLSCEEFGASQSFEHIAIAPDQRMTHVRAPFRFNGQAPAATKAAPALGSDTDDVLIEAGLSRTEIEELRQRGIIGMPNEQPAPAASALS